MTNTTVSSIVLGLDDIMKEIKETNRLLGLLLEKSSEQKMSLYDLNQKSKGIDNKKAYIERVSNQIKNYEEPLLSQQSISSVTGMDYAYIISLRIKGGLKGWVKISNGYYLSKEHLLGEWERTAGFRNF